MLDAAIDNIAEFSPAEPGIHPIAARIRDIILSRAAEGEPTTADDLAHIPPGDLKDHFPAARAAADRIVVRQLDDARGFETRAQLLSRATTVLMRRMPSSVAMRQALSTMGLTTAEIDDIWPDIVPTLADAFTRLNGKVH